LDPLANLKPELEKCDLVILIGESLLAPLSDLITILMTLDVKVVLVTSNFDVENTAADLVIHEEYHIYLQTILEILNEKKNLNLQ